MTDELKAKLREIILKAFGGYLEYGEWSESPTIIADVMAAEIDQAYKDAGYVPLNQELTNLLAQQKSELIRLSMTPTPEYKIVRGDQLKEVMTSQEWVDRLDMELRKGWDGEYREVYEAIMRVAKRAAGLTNNERQK